MNEDLFTPATELSNLSYGDRETAQGLPLETLHPVTVKVQHPHVRFPFPHSLQKARNRFFIIVGGEGSGQPQTEGP
jgi:hypothetical protein